MSKNEELLRYTQNGKLTRKAFYSSHFVLRITYRKSHIYFFNTEEKSGALTRQHDFTFYSLKYLKREVGVTGRGRGRGLFV